MLNLDNYVIENTGVNCHNADCNVHKFIHDLNGFEFEEKIKEYFKDNKNIFTFIEFESQRYSDYVNCYSVSAEEANFNKVDFEMGENGSYLGIKHFKSIEKDGNTLLEMMYISPNDEEKEEVKIIRIDANELEKLLG